MPTRCALSWAPDCSAACPRAEVPRVPAPLVVRKGAIPTPSRSPSRHGFAVAAPAARVGPRRCPALCAGSAIASDARARQRVPHAPRADPLRRFALIRLSHRTRARQRVPHAPRADLPRSKLSPSRARCLARSCDRLPQQPEHRGALRMATRSTNPLAWVAWGGNAGNAYTSRTP